VRSAAAAVTAISAAVVNIDHITWNLSFKWRMAESSSDSIKEYMRCPMIEYLTHVTRAK
jgi:hypothetical protein